MSTRLLLLLLLVNAAIAWKKCKTLPGDPSFPSPDTWASFAKNLSQPLISNQLPLGAPCHKTSPAYDPQACAAVTAQQFSHTFLAASPNGIQWTNYMELVANNTVQQCVFDPQPDAICYQGRVPSYSINVSTVADVQHTIRFATTHNLHLVVKNNGHENLGRMFGYGSVELFMHNLRDYTFTDSFVPEGAPSGTAGQHAVTIDPGVQWGTLYSLASQNNRTVAGGIGAGGTVGAGAGWPLGGGHSILSPYYGLGVDNVLQFSVVLPNASFVVTNQYQYPDLFWALRGGGGPNFGVVMKTTFRTHPNPPYTAAFYAATANSNSSYFQLLETFNKHHNSIADSGWAGFWPFQEQTLYLTLIAQGAPTFNTTANSTLQSFISDSAAIPGVNITLNKQIVYSDFEDWYYNNFINSTNGFGFNYTVGDAGGLRITVSSWLIPRDVFDNNATALAEAWMGIPASRPFMVGGGAVAQGDPDSAAVTPAWRTTISDMTIANAWAENATVAEIQAIKQGVYDQIQPLRALAPVPLGGQYINEPDDLEVDWQGAYWGRHYPRLLALKKIVDPNDLFIVYKGVNSESWDANVVCKTLP